MDSLPLHEQLQVWDETERNFWTETHQKWDQARQIADKEHQKQIFDIKVDTASLLGRQKQLTETQSRLMRELANVEKELSQVVTECDSKAERLQHVENDYRQQAQEDMVKRENLIKAMAEYFDRMRAEAAQQAINEEQPARSPQVANGHAESEAPEATAEALVDIIDADGNVIGPVRRIEPWNQWVEAIQDMPIRRPVKIRRNRKFNQVHLDSIYERAEAKGVKWLSCMIQAIGDVQAKRCVSCDKNQGAFDDCIIVGGDLFPKCGNCEWNRQGCHGASKQIILPTRDKEVEGQDNAQQDEKSTPSKPVEDEGQLQKEQAMEQAFAKASDLSQAPPHSTPARPTTEVDSRPATKSASPSGDKQERPASVFNVTSGFTPANIRSRPESFEIPTPSVASPLLASTEASQSPTLTPAATPSEAAHGVADSLEEITKENLALRDNGTVYTSPSCLEGVPLVKIDQNHPYWESSWPDVRSVIEPALQSWRAKHEIAVENDLRGEKQGSSKYQIGRQVNRGLKILDFLENGDISPYQLLNKHYMHSGKGGIISYDTLFRLADTLSELAKFKLDITPLEWLRHRLHELILEDGGMNFNLSKTIHHFYHDPKLSALRIKHGFKNIGRPSAGKSGRQSLGSAGGTPRPSQAKRKGLHSQTNTPRSTPALDGSPLVTHSSAPSPKRIKNQAQAPSDDELYTADFSDADSWCGSQLNMYDWRVYQIKTRVYTTAVRVTQYWTWQEARKRFEHQVLTDVDPPKWGVLKEPLNFNVRLDEIAEIVWNLSALQLHIVVHKARMVVAKKDGQPRGDVMVAFKRERTMKRFLSFCRERKIPLVEKPVDDLGRRWDNLQSEQLPDTDEEATEELKG